MMLHVGREIQRIPLPPIPPGLDPEMEIYIRSLHNYIQFLGKTLQGYLVPETPSTTVKQRLIFSETTGDIEWSATT